MVANKKLSNRLVFNVQQWTNEIYEDFSLQNSKVSSLSALRKGERIEQNEVSFVRQAFASDVFRPERWSKIRYMKIIMIKNMKFVFSEEEISKLTSIRILLIPFHRRWWLCQTFSIQRKHLPL